MFSGFLKYSCHGFRAAAFLFPLFCFLPHSAQGAQCRVIDPELQGKYEGGCRNGLASGYGVAKGTAEYHGEFSKGLKDGTGVKTWPWGDRYEGGFRDDRRHGKGTYTWGAQSPWAGERYEGDYVRDLREGTGTYYWPNGDRFEGQWKADLRYGYSAMELRRQAAQKARGEGGFNPGAQVCSWAKIGIAHPVLRIGKIEEIEGSTLKVRLLGTEQSPDVLGNGMAPGTLLTGTMTDWTPCL